MHYRKVLVKTYWHTSGNSKHDIRAQPLPGQGLDPNMYVECSSKMREKHPVGTVFLIQAKIKEPKTPGDTPHLYTSWQWKYEVIPSQNVESILQSLRLQQRP